MVSFDSDTPGTLTTIANLTGVITGHGVRAIDFRPATGQLYAISTSGAAAGQLYTVNLETWALTPVGAGFVLGTNASNQDSMDFNPVGDHIRVVTGGATSNNFRVHPNDGTLTAADTSLAFAFDDTQAGGTFSIVGIAYTNNSVGAASTTLLAWDFGDDALLRIGGPGGTPSPNGGQMNTIQAPSAFLAFNGAAGFDISPATGVAYVAHDDPATGTLSRLHTRQLATGAETPIGNFPAGVFVIGISVAPTAACCNRRTCACVILSAGLCGTLGQQPLCPGSACSGIMCPACPRDFTQNGVRDVSDIFAFLTAWFAGCP